MPLSKEKKHQSKNANRSGREAAVTPAAGGSNKDLEFTIKRQRHQGNMWKPMGFKTTQKNSLATISERTKNEEMENQRRKCY